MTSFLARCLLLVTLASGFSLPGSSSVRVGSTSSVNVSDPTVWSLVWRDEFNGPTGSAVDPAKWVSETGGGGWGNNELEYYTNRPVNAHIENGALVISALRETYTGPDNVTRDYPS